MKAAAHVQPQRLGTLRSFLSYWNSTQQPQISAQIAENILCILLVRYETTYFVIIQINFVSGGFQRLRRASYRRQSRCRSICRDSAFADVPFQKLIIGFSGCHCRWRNRTFFDFESIKNHLFPQAGASFCCS